MMLFLHILIALSSIVVSGLAYLRPTKQHISASYGWIAATFASGTYLVILSPTHLPSACVSGLLYLAVAGTMTVAAQRKFAKQTSL